MYKTIIMPVDVFEEYAFRFCEDTGNGGAVKRRLVKSFKTMVSHFTIDPSRIKQHVRFGSVRDEVNELAEELGADVVVIGSRNPSISTHLLGSNASSVIRHANLPVLVVR